jgi:hypothetical protein
MARNRKQAPNKGTVLFDVVYQDGTRTSNRKVPSAEVGGLEGDAPARAYIEAQDREIETLSGRPRGPIRSVIRSPGQ